VDVIEAHGLALREFDQRMRKIRPDQWELATPCDEWSVRDLVRHLVHEQMWAPELLAGCTPEQVGDRFDGDILGADPLHSWVLAAAAAREAWITPKALLRPVQLSYGRETATEYCWQMTTDLAVHAWDLGRAIGVNTRINPALVDAVLEYVSPKAEKWQATGLFGEPIPIPDDADAQTQLIAMLGRQP